MKPLTPKQAAGLKRWCANLKVGLRARTPQELRPTFTKALGSKAA